MKTPTAIAKRFDGATAADAEPYLTWFVSRERASLVGWAVMYAYVTKKETPVSVVTEALKDDFDLDFIKAATTTKSPFLTLDDGEKRYFAYLCDVIRQSVSADSWTGEGKDEVYARTRAVVERELAEVIERARALVAERDALVA